MTWPHDSTPNDVWPLVDSSGGGAADGGIQWFDIPGTLSFTDTGPICDEKEMVDGIMSVHMDPAFVTTRATINSGQCYTTIAIADIPGMEDFDHLTEEMVFLVRPLLPGTGNNEVMFCAGLVDDEDATVANGKACVWREFNATQHAAGLAVGGSSSVAGAGTAITLDSVFGALSFGADPGGTFTTAMSVVGEPTDGEHPYAVAPTGTANLVSPPSECFAYFACGRGSNDAIPDKSFVVEFKIGRRTRTIPE